MFTCGGILVLVLGLCLLWFFGDGEGFGRLFPRLLGVLLCLMGLYIAFFETGEGLGRFFPSLAP